MIVAMDAARRERASSLRAGRLVVVAMAIGLGAAGAASAFAGQRFATPTRGFTIAATPPLSEQQKLTSSILGPGKKIVRTGFGWSVAVAANGDTALIGSSSYRRPGAAWVFVRKGSTWTEQQKLTAPTSGAGKKIGQADFGSRVALSSDGDTALVGAIEEDGGAGAAWVFTRRRGAWSEQQKLTAPTSGLGRVIGRQGGFGASVALAANGDVALVGGFGDHEDVGAAWEFTRRRGAWSEQQKLTAPTSGAGKEHGHAGFGLSVALAANGDLALIGAPAGEGYAQSGPGAAWVFTRMGGAWTYQDKLTPPSNGGGRVIGSAGFGSDVALAGDGEVALIGGPSDNGDIGAAWVFSRGGATWRYEVKLTVPSSGIDSEIGEAAFGTTVALSTDAHTALVGGPYDNGNLGAAWEFAFQPPHLSKPGYWTEGEKLTAPTTGAGLEEGDALFGEAVALAGDGDTALIGGPNAPSGLVHGTPGSGAAWVFASPKTRH